MTGNVSDLLERLRLERETSEPIGELSLEDAYRRQDELIRSRIERGEEHAGWKIGCTSQAIQAEFGLNQPIRGHLMTPHVHRSPTSLRVGEYLTCAVEPEFVIRFGSRLEGENLSYEEIWSTIEEIAPGVEIHNYHFFFPPPTSQELIISNGLHAGLVVGDFKPVRERIDLDLEGIGIFINGGLAGSGIGAEIMGGVLSSIRWLVNSLAETGDALSPGELVIPGSPVNLERVEAGDVVEARFTNFGDCRVEFV